MKGNYFDNHIFGKFSVKLQNTFKINGQNPLGGERFRSYQKFEGDFISFAKDKTVFPAEKESIEHSKLTQPLERDLDSPRLQVTLSTIPIRALSECPPSPPSVWDPPVTVWFVGDSPTLGTPDR